MARMFTGGIAALFGAVMVWIAPSVHAKTCTWNGSTGTGWISATNWSCAPSGAPVNGDDLVFPDAAANKVNIQNNTGLTNVNSISITGCGYDITGTALTVLSAAPITALCAVSGQSNSLNLSTLNLGSNPTIANNVGGPGTGSFQLYLGNATNRVRWSGTLRFDNGSNPNSRVIASLSELAPGNIAVASGSLVLPFANLYTGTTLVENGVLQAMVPGALGSEGSLASGTTVRSGGVLRYDVSFADEFLTLDDNNPLEARGPILRSGGVALTWGGPIATMGLPSGSGDPPRAELSALGGATATRYTGVISGSSSVFFTDVGPTHLSEFSAANTYAGLTDLGIGEVLIGSGVNRLPASTTVKMASSQSTLRFQDSVGVSQTIAGLSATAGNLVLNGVSGSAFVINTSPPGASFNGVISGNVPITISGTGKQTLAGNNTYSGTIEVIGDAALALNESNASLDVRFGGNGAIVSDAAASVRSVAPLVGSTGQIRPGDNGGFGVLTVSGTAGLRLESGAALHLEISNSSVFDQLNSAGDVQLNNGTLNLNFLSDLAPGETIVIVNKTSPGSIVGIFQGLSEGAVLLSGSSAPYAISYLGGDGNDVTLTRIAGGPSAITVDSVSDPGLPGECSLRSAVQAINTGVPVNACPAGNPGDRIDFDPALFSGGARTITLNAGEIAITEGLIIDGPGARLLTIDAAESSRVFQIDDGTVSVVPVAISGLRLVGGRASFEYGLAATAGGAILTFEALELHGLAFSNNEAHGDQAKGGAVAVFDAPLIITETLFTGNNALSATDNSIAFGGAIYINGGTLQMVNSTLDNNQAGVIGASVASIYPQALGGAIMLIDSPGTIDYSTLVRNYTQAANLTSGTIESSGGAIYTTAVGSSTLLISNSVLGANQARSTGSARALYDEIARAGLANVQTDFASIMGTLEAGVTQNNAITGAPELQPLEDNGGNTDTVSFLISSSLRDHAGPPQPPPFDQRGVLFNRPIGADADIGAFELQLDLTPATPNLSSASVGTPYLENAISAFGGSGSFIYSVISGALPPGLSINSSTGDISGTPSSDAGSPYIFVLQAQDSGDPTQRVRARYQISVSGSVSQFTWTGAVDGDWMKPGNWSPASIPNPGSSVLFPAGPFVQAIGNAPAISLDYLEISGGYTISGASQITLTNSIPLRISSAGAPIGLALPLLLSHPAATVNVNAESDTIALVDLGSPSGDFNFSGDIEFALSNVPAGSMGHVVLRPHFQGASQSGDVRYTRVSGDITHVVELGNESNYAGTTYITGPHLAIYSLNLAAPFGDTGAGVTDTELTDAAVVLVNTSLTASAYGIDRERLIARSTSATSVASLSSAHVTAGSAVQWTGVIDFSGVAGAEYFDLGAEDSGILRIGSGLTGAGLLRIGQNISTAGTVALDGVSTFVGDIEIHPQQELLTLNNELIPDAASVILLGTARFDLNGNQETIAGLEGNNPPSVVDVTGSLSTPGQLSLSAGVYTYVGQILDAPGPELGGGVRITGGFHNFVGDSTFSQPLQLLGGSLRSNAALPEVEFDGGTLIAQAGLNVEQIGVASGSSGGLLRLVGPIDVALNVDLSSPVMVQSNIDIKDNGSLHALGSVTLAGATLSFTAIMPMPIGDSFTMIEADGGVSGQFAGVPDGTVLTAGPFAFRVDYTATTVDVTRVALSAPDVIVTTADDPGSAANCSLRRAIESVNTGITPVDSNCAAGLPGSVIRFDGAVFSSPQTITLSEGEIEIENDMAIDGPGPRLLTIDALGASRIFRIDDSLSSVAQVQISGLNLINGEAESGGAIHTEEDLTLLGMRFGANRASEAMGSYGGAIYISNDSTVLIADSLFVNNQALNTQNGNAAGGAVFSLGATTITNSTFSANSVVVNGSGEPFAWGGAAYLAENNSSVLNCTIVGNSTQATTSKSGGTVESAGAGVFIEAEGSSFLVENSVFFNNSSTATGNGQLGARDLYAMGIGSFTTRYSSFEVLPPPPISNSNLVSGAPLLKPLANNGGQTDTFNFSNNSPLRDAADPATQAPPFDQRGPGYPRVVGTLDVGAYEQGLLLTPLLANLPGATVGTLYSGGVSASGGQGPFVYSISGGNLPPGLNLDAGNGSFVGTPTTPGLYNFTVLVSDATLPIAQQVSGDYSINVLAPVLNLSVANASVGGDTAGATLDFVVSLSSPSASDVTVQVDTSAVDAEPSDYTAIAGQTVTIPAGQVSSVVQVSVSADTIVEPAESILLSLSNPVGATISTATASGTIQNDDQAILSVNASSSGLEDQDAVASISSSNPIEGNAQIAYTLLGGDHPDPFQNATGADFGTAVPVSPSISLAPVNVTIPIIDDALVEAPEQLRLQLTGVTPPAGISATDIVINSSADTFRHTIINNDATLLSSSSTSVSEGDSGNAQLSYVLSLSAPAEAPVQVVLNVIPSGTFPVDASDFVAFPQTVVSFPVGTTTQTVNVGVVGDSIVEPNETLLLTLTDPSLPIATISTSSVQGVIDNDDSATVSVDSASAPEGNSGNTPMSFTLSLSHPVQGIVGVTVSTSAGTATEGSDYLGLANVPVSFASLALTSTQTVSIIGDTVQEPNENFSLAIDGLSLPPGIGTVSLASGSGTGQIIDDDDFGASVVALTTALPKLPYAPGISYPVNFSVRANVRPSGTAMVIATRSGMPKVSSISCTPSLAPGAAPDELVGSCTLAPSSPGEWVTTVSFVGSGGFADGSLQGAAVFTAGLAPLDIQQSLDTTVVGQPFTVTISGQSVAGGPVPEGVVTVTQFPGSLQTMGNLSGGTVSVNLLSTSAVVKGLLISYADPSLVYSVPDQFVSHTTNPANTATTISLSANSGSANVPVTVTYTLGVLAPGAIVPGGSPPSGQIQVSDGVSSSTCALVYPTGACVLSPSTSGNRQITARYFGDQTYAGSVSAPSSYMVGQGTGTVDVAVSIGNGVRLIHSNTVVYTINVRNFGDTPVSNVLLTNALPVGASAQSYTCVAAPGSQCGSSSGVGAISDSLQVGTTGSVSYRVVVSLENSDAAFSNTATVAVPNGLVDADLSNNTATDTDPKGIFGAGFESEIE